MALPRAFTMVMGTHGQPLDVHLPDASSLLLGSYASPPENWQLSPSFTLHHGIYESVLGNPFNPVAPTGLAPQALSPFLPSTFRVLRPYHLFRADRLP